MKPILISKVKSLLLIRRAPTLFRRSAGNLWGKNAARGEGWVMPKQKSAASAPFPYAGKLGLGVKTLILEHGFVKLLREGTVRW